MAALIQHANRALYQASTALGHNRSSGGH